MNYSKKNLLKFLNFNKPVFQEFEKHGIRWFCDMDTVDIRYNDNIIFDDCTIICKCSIHECNKNLPLLFAFLNAGINVDEAFERSFEDEIN